MAQMEVLSSKAEVGANSALEPPHGLGEIITQFGDIHRYIGGDGTLDAAWQADYLTLVALPFPLALAWDLSLKTVRMRCHRKLATKMLAVFAELQGRGLQDKLSSFGGCFAYRPQRGALELSTHCWGIALDLNCATNRQGTAGDMDVGLVEVFRDAGFEWGGDWQGPRRDPMHFQYCSGY